MLVWQRPRQLPCGCLYHEMLRSENGCGRRLRELTMPVLLGDSSQTCGGGNLIGVYKLASSSSGWTNVGCFADQDPRTLSGASFTDSNGMTPAACQAKCSGYTYAGVEFGVECYCGNDFTTKTPSASCNVPCAGDNSQMCGGPWAVSVFQNGGGSSGATTTLSPPPTQTGYVQVGCYRDSDTRLLQSGQGADNSGRTQQSCFDQCSSQGYCYAGLENGNECWCGASLDSSASIDASQCSTPCTGNGGTTCGGGWALSVFYDKSQSKCSGVMSGSPAPTTTSTTAAAPSPTSGNNGGSNNNGGGNSGGSWWRSNGGNSGKVIVAHVIVGNTYVSLEITLFVLPSDLSL